MKQIAIIGATASGKTALALELAPLLNAVILSLDSLCVYKEISVASAKPSPDELASIKHFGVDLKSVDEDFSAGEFFCEYKRASEFCKAQGKNLIITGGSGFYLKALISGLAPRVPRASFYPQNNEIFALAKSCDSEFCAKYSANDTFRLQKWFDIYSFLGNSSLGNSRIPSEFLKANTKEPLIKNIEIYELCWEKELLKERIKKRTCAMLSSGLLGEAKRLFDSFDGSLKPLNSVGLKECGQFLRGEILNENELKELIITHTAQLAKRQRTFFNSQFSAKKLSFESAKSMILESCKEWRC